MALSDADFRRIAARQEPRVLLHHEVVKFARAIEAEARREALEEAAAAVEKATYRKRWAKAVVNSHPDDVPPCEFAALIRALKEPTP